LPNGSRVHRIQSGVATAPPTEIGTTSLPVSGFLTCLRISAADEIADLVGGGNRPILAAETAQSASGVCTLRTEMRKEKAHHKNGLG
jgi:hypothetical protein